MPITRVARSGSLLEGFPAGWEVGFHFLYHCTMDLSQSPWVEILALPFTHSVTLGNLLAILALQFAHR